MREAVAAARGSQHARQPLPNARLSGKALDQHAPMTADASALLRRALTELGLSARADDNARRIARTIADLDTDDTALVGHLFVIAKQIAEQQGLGTGYRLVINVGDEIEIVGIKDTSKTTCTGVEMFRKLLDRGEAGDNIGALLRGVDREGVERGQVLCKPGSVNPHTKFEAEAYILTKDEGGRHTPFFANYRPQFYFRTTDVTGTVELPAGTEMVMPGDNLKFNVELIAPIAMEHGLRFAIREGGRTVGAGVVSKINE